MPLATYLALETDPDEALIISIVLVAVSFTVLIGLRDRWLSGARTAFT
jgi:molybdate transport system permease protein